MPDRRARGIALGIGVVAGVGLVDAALTREPDLVALFAVIVALCLLWVGTTVGTRSTLRVRADLRAWLQMRSDITGEDPEQLADRALATYRLHLGDPERAGAARDGPERPVP